MEEKPLHVQVAEALGWTKLKCLGNQDSWEGLPPLEPDKFGRRWISDWLPLTIPRYDTDWAATGPLIEKHGINVRGGPGRWWTMADWPTHQRHIVWAGQAETPLIAVCNLILAFAKEGKF